MIAGHHHPGRRWPASCLSVGMAVDANVLIFERTRDELRHGRGVGAAVDTGFRRAFPAIRDSNVSTIIACLVLAILGTDVVRGFAITLGIGVAVSFFSAVTVTRALLAAALRLRLGRNPTLYTQIHEEYAEKPPRRQVRHRALAQLVLRGVAGDHHPRHPGDHLLGLPARAWTSAAATRSTSR